MLTKTVALVLWPRQDGGSAVPERPWQLHACEKDTTQVGRTWGLTTGLLHLKRAHTSKPGGVRASTRPQHVVMTSECQHERRNTADYEAAYEPSAEGASGLWSKP